MKFDLYRLGPREFENLTQAIAVAELGPNAVVYGMGSDGGREVTQSDGDTYTVLQAKYKEVSGSAQAEATWLIKELRKEFKEWRDSEKRGKKPQKFIVATNVTLSATPKSGGIDRVAKVMKEECSKLEIQDWVVWHSENINRFLEKNPGIRTSYAAWILPGDILSAIYEDVSKRNSESVKAIRSYVPKELLNDRYANLDQAGSADDRTVPLADVFFDVPVGLSPERNAATREQRCLKTLIRACDARHSVIENPALVDESERIPQVLNRFVLVGGPGQGKSTVSQFLCQLYRAQLVKDTSSMRNPEVRAAVSQINTQASKEGLLPKARRWPMNIPLTRFADELAQHKCNNLLDYIAQRVSETSAAHVSSVDVRDWLQKFPWLLILDGLDEVPGSSNRTQVLSHISTFQLEADEMNADLVVVATTRPQGYTDDFSPKHYAHYYLTALDTTSALGYGRKLADARHGNSSERVARLMARLERAAAEPSTAHLMSTPLQVTIMAVLLDRVGKAPKDRFTLFADYYRVIFERELEKEGAASNLLRDHKTDIDSIHADVGLLLQTRSERSGETESRITVEELDTIINDRLDSEGHQGAELEELTAAISRAATHRLVFLVPSRDGEVSFEIRSLQEFWAADALMNCSEDEIGRRLRIMAVSSHWRNVLLFALGNIFATRRNNLRDSIVALVSELNAFSEEFGNLPRRILTGSRLAVEVLNDGMVRAPRYEAVLVEQSLKLLSHPYSEHVALLAGCLSDRGMEIIRDHFSAENVLFSEPGEAVWAFLATRAAHNDTWAYQQLLALYDTADDSRKKEMFDVAINFEIPVLLHVAVRSFLEPNLSFRLAEQISILSSSNYAPLMEPEGCSEPPPWLPSIVALFSGRLANSPRKYTPAFRIGAFLGHAVSILERSSLLSDVMAAGLPRDHWIAAVISFCENPSKEALAEVVGKIDIRYADRYSNVAHNLPWVINYGNRLHKEFGEAATELIREGYLGDVAEWIEIEQRWGRNQGVYPATDELTEWKSQTSTFLPLSASRTSSRRGTGDSLGASEVLQTLQGIRGNEARRRLAEFFFRTTDSFHQDVSPQDLEKIYAMTAPDGTRYGSYSWVSEWCEGEGWMSLIDRMGRDAIVGLVWVPYRLPDSVADYWVRDFSRVGLGRLFAARGAAQPMDSQLMRKIFLEWERLREDSNSDSQVKRTVCMAVSFCAPPEDDADAADRISCLAAAISAGEVIIGYVASSLALDSGEPSRKMILGLADIAELRPSDRQSLHERMVRLQASTPTEIEYDAMRPC
ncbi:NACHT domain-containing protein [Streptomyces sp. NPDC091879]|uniref:NACHT domain-containing protein n=1 Tax=Streptomyces sp. NPDC091879 TaxID=3366006 RepID=UPI0038208F87